MGVLLIVSGGSGSEVGKRRDARVTRISIAIHGVTVKKHWDKMQESYKKWE